MKKIQRGGFLPFEIPTVGGGLYIGSCSTWMHQHLIVEFILMHKPFTILTREKLPMQKGRKAKGGYLFLTCYSHVGKISK